MTATLKPIEQPDGTSAGIESSAGFGSLVRPTTRGELRNALSEGKPCEIPDVGVEMTTIMLRHWLNCVPFTVEKSTNDGRVLFLPNVPGQPRGDESNA